VHSALHDVASAIRQALRHGVCGGSGARREATEPPSWRCNALEETTSTVDTTKEEESVVPPAALDVASSSPGRRCRLKPIEPRVGSAWSQDLQLKYDTLLSSFAFNFNLRRYVRAPSPPTCSSTRTSGPPASCSQLRACSPSSLSTWRPRTSSPAWTRLHISR